MMGPDIYIPAYNHNFDRIDIPMRIQGTSDNKPVVIEDDCWIGARVIITSGKRICKGTIVGAGSVVTRNVENILLSEVTLHDLYEIGIIMEKVQIVNMISIEIL